MVNVFPYNGRWTVKNQSYQKILLGKVVENIIMYKLEKENFKKKRNHPYCNTLQGVWTVTFWLDTRETPLHRP